MLKQMMKGQTLLKVDTTKRIHNAWVNQNPHRLANSIKTLAEKRVKGINEKESKLTVTGASCRYNEGNDKNCTKTI